ncbi:hypothetical protein [Salinibacter ruber]|uniref:hypothetical protein n=1 Tax=Salinibacter ruber TaxID=146919 RepID=UPI00216A00B9|nr:hypothetical protein [Salinibacter ruber]
MDAAKQMEWKTPSMTEYGSVEALTGTWDWGEEPDGWECETIFEWKWIEIKECEKTFGSIS